MQEVTTNEHLSSFSPQGEVNIDELKRTFATGRTKTYQWRVEQLTALNQMIVENEKEIIAALHTDLGKS